MTFREIFNSIADDDVRSRAIANATESGKIDKECTNEAGGLSHKIAVALGCGFAWCHTPEGEKFWQAQYRLALNLYFTT